MKCVCGGKLKRITSSKYECERCGLYTAVAFMELSKPVTNMNTLSNTMPTTIENIQPNTDTQLDDDLIKKLQDEIFNSLGVSSKFLKRR